MIIPAQIGDAQLAIKPRIEIHLDPPVIYVQEEIRDNNLVYDKIAPSIPRKTVVYLATHSIDR
jgi:hypothetical protein